MEGALDSRLVATLVTMDVEGAFDTVLKRRLMLRLREQGWPPNVVLWAESFMSARTAYVRYDGVMTEAEPLQCGLPQGSPASPVLYLLYTEPIHQLGPGRFGYADDCGLLTIGRTLDETAEKAQEGINAALAWGRENGVKFSPEKTEVQHFYRKRQAGPPHPCGTARRKSRRLGERSGGWACGSTIASPSGSISK